MTRSIKDATGGQLFNAAYHVLNEHGQIMGQWFTHSDSPDELTQQVSDMKARFDDGDGLKYLWLDHQPLAGPFEVAFEDTLKHVLVDVFHIMQRFTRLVPESWSFRVQFMDKLTLAFYNLHMEDVTRYHLHMREVSNWTSKQCDNHFKDNKIFYYKQDYIRKSVHHQQPLTLINNLNEVISWLESLTTATEGDPLPLSNF